MIRPDYMISNLVQRDVCQQSSDTHLIENSITQLLDNRNVGELLCEFLYYDFRRLKNRDNTGNW